MELLDVKQETADYPYPKECRHCHWCHRDLLFGYNRFATCHHPETQDSLSTSYAHIERDSRFDNINACGSTGKLWQPRKNTLWQRIVARLW